MGFRNGRAYGTVKETLKPIWITKLNCSGTERSLSQCVDRDTKWGNPVYSCRPAYALCYNQGKSITCKSNIFKTFQKLHFFYFKGKYVCVSCAPSCNKLTFVLDCTFNLWWNTIHFPWTTYVLTLNVDIFSKMPIFCFLYPWR